MKTESQDGGQCHSPSCARTHQNETELKLSRDRHSDLITKMQNRMEIILLFTYLKGEETEAE